MFQYVYPPHGTELREFLVKVEYFGEASSFLEVARGELARQMSIVAIKAVFIDPYQAIDDANLPPWKPYTRGLNPIQEA
jgi:hypothetical protein